MRAVVMAGGAGTRLRPLTAARPKPLLPVANVPILGHVLALLRRHGFTDPVITVQYLASMLRGHYDDGAELGMRLTYATESAPLGTAGGVRNARAAIDEEGTLLVLGGDVLTDIDLGALVAAHRRSGALLTVGLVRRPDPVEFGLVVTDDAGRVQRLLEKPDWDQVLTDTVSTGIYVVEPEVFDHVPSDRPSDWSADVVPALLAAGLPVHGEVCDGYFEDIGTLEAYRRANLDVVESLVEVETSGFWIGEGVQVGLGTEVDPLAIVLPPVLIGPHCKIEADAQVGPGTVLGAGTVVGRAAVVERSVVLDNAFIDEQASLTGCVVGENTAVRRSARIDSGAVVAERCRIGEEAYVAQGVAVYPERTVEPGALVLETMVLQSRTGLTPLAGRRASGLVNVDMTPEQVVRLANAWASHLPKGSTVVTGRDPGRAARTLSMAATAALTAAGIAVRDLGVTPLPVVRHEVASRDATGGIVLAGTPGEPRGLDLLLLGPDGDDLDAASRQAVQRTWARQDFRRAFPGEIARMMHGGAVGEDYVDHLLATVGADGVAGSGLRVVVDAGSGAVPMVLPALLGRLGVEVLMLGARICEEPAPDPAAELAAVGALVASAGAAFGVRFDTLGERLSLVDDTGHPVADDRALLILMDLVAAEARRGRVALPDTFSRVAEQVAAFHGIGLVWTDGGPGDLARSVRHPDVLLGGDGAGGFVVPSVSGSYDSLAAFTLLVGLVARTRLRLSEIDARIPPGRVHRLVVPTGFARRGVVMRHVHERAADDRVDSPVGVRVCTDEGWVVVLPDPDSPGTLVVAEAADDEASSGLALQWAGVVEAAVLGV